LQLTHVRVRRKENNLVERGEKRISRKEEGRVYMICLNWKESRTIEFEFVPQRVHSYQHAVVEKAKIWIELTHGMKL
jgi:hypothetical protein